jgi:hypothetical protein
MKNILTVFVGVLVAVLFSGCGLASISNIQYQPEIKDKFVSKDYTKINDKKIVLVDTSVKDILRMNPSGYLHNQGNLDRNYTKEMLLSNKPWGDEEKDVSYMFQNTFFKLKNIHSQFSKEIFSQYFKNVYTNNLPDNSFADLTIKSGIIDSVIYVGSLYHGNWKSLIKIEVKVYDKNNSLILNKKYIESGGDELIAAHLNTFILSLNDNFRGNRDSVLTMEAIKKAYKKQIIPDIIKALKGEKVKDSM